MRVTWLVEQHIFDDVEEALREEVEGQGHQFMIAYDNLTNEDYNELFTPDDCVVFYGSLQLARRIQTETRFEPHIYCTFKNYECTSYYPHFAPYMLNQQYVMLPIGDLRRQKEWLAATVGKYGSFFCRPNSGAKTFTGQVVHLETFEKDYEMMRFYDVSEEELVVVSGNSRLQHGSRVRVAGGLPPEAPQSERADLPRKRGAGQ